jgi:hypothetical protein
LPLARRKSSKSLVCCNFVNNGLHSNAHTALSRDQCRLKQGRGGDSAAIARGEIFYSPLCASVGRETFFILPAYVEREREHDLSIVLPL